MDRSSAPDDANRALESRFFELSIDMLCILGFDRRFRHVNRAWETTLGFSREELMSQPFVDFVHPDDRERTVEQNIEVRSGGQARSFENRYRCKDGSYRWLLWNARPDPDHQVIYGIARDMTAKKAAEAEREALIRRLEGALAEVNALRGLFPICSYCKRIRDDQNYWRSVEEYFASHSDMRFSHGICPTCLPKVVEREWSS
ncbi:MAG TPA: PAS domain S-box protein [Vicinamibacterales bacterium]|nr:PAS domain S-box protein [Vicinamibacterales bacterium]